MELNNIRFEEVNPTLVQHLYFRLCHIKKHWIWKTFPFLFSWNQLQNQLHLKNLTELIEGDLKDLEQAGVFYLDINTPGFWPLTITFWDFPCFFPSHSLSLSPSVPFILLWVHLWMEFPFPVVSLSSSNHLWYLMKDWSCCSPLDCC